MPSGASKRLQSITVHLEPDSQPSVQETDIQPAEKVPAISSSSQDQLQPEVAYYLLTFSGSADRRIKRPVALKHNPQQ